MLKHAFDVMNPKNGIRFPACQSTERLWSILLRADAGAKEGAKRAGLTDWETAADFVSQAQKAYPAYVSATCLAGSALPNPICLRRV